MSPTWYINGVDLSERWVLEPGTFYRPPITARANLLTIPGRHGVVDVDPAPIFDEPQLTLAVTLLDGATTLDAAQAELSGLLSTPTLTVTRVVDDVAAWAYARLVAAVCTEYLWGQAARFQVVLALPGVFLRGVPGGVGYAPGAIGPGDYFDGDSPGAYWTGVPHASTSVWDGSTSHVPTPTASTSATLDSLAGSTAPITDAVLRLAGPLTSAVVTDAVTGTGLSWSGATIAAGTYLYLDAATLRAWSSTSGGQWTPGGTDRTAGLDYPGAGPLQLWPAAQDGDPADRQVHVTVALSGMGEGTALTVRAAPAYL